MTAAAPYRPLECPEAPSPLPRGKGLLDPRFIPCEFPAGDRILSERNTPSARIPGTFVVVLRLLWWSLKLAYDRRFRPGHLIVTGQQAARLFADLQGFWFELSRILGQRSDYLPIEVRDEIARDCHPRPALDFGEVSAIVESELGFPLRLAFTQFDHAPFRVGMYADSYRARLRREELDVIVKIRRPGLEQRLTRDLRVLRVVASIVRRRKSEKSTAAWDDLIGTLEERVPALLDLRYEASATRRMKKSLRDHKVYVPRIIRGYAHRLLIVHEFVDAPTLQELISHRQSDPVGAEGWLVANEIDLEKSGRRLYQSMLRQICEDNLFQQEMGPSNVQLLRESRVALVSCDAVTTVDKRFLAIFNLAITAMTRKDYEKFADTLFLLCKSLPATDLGAVRAGIIRAARTYSARAVLEDASHEEKSLFVLTQEIALLLHRHGIVLDPQALKIMWAMSSTDSCLTATFPRMNYTKELARYATKSASRRLRNLVRGGAGNAVTGVVTPVVEMLRFETASMRKRAQNFRASTGKVAYVFATITRWLARSVIVGVVVGLWVFLHQHHSSVVAPFRHTHASQAASRVQHLPYGYWVVLFISAFLLYRIIRDIARRLAAREVEPEKA